MAQNRSLLVVLLGSFVLAAGILAVASLRPGTGPDDVALRVGGVEVTFSEYELRTAETIATRPVTDLLIAGEDFGLPPEAVEQMQKVQSIFGPLQPDVDEDVSLVISVVAPTAAYAAAVAEGHAPSELAIAERVLRLERMDETVRTGDEPILAFARAMYEAKVTALGEERYRDEYLPLRARDSLAGDILTDDLDLSAEEAGIVPVTLSWRAAEDADLWIHPDLGVTSEEVRTELDRMIRYQEAVVALTEEWELDFED